MDDRAAKPKNTSRKKPWVLPAILVAAALTLAVVALLLFSSASDDVSTPQDSATVQVDAAGDDIATLEVAVGEPADAAPYVIPVTGAGFQELELIQPPPEGTAYFVVGVEFRNAGETVPVNGQPKRVDGTLLESDDASYEGIMQVDLGNPMQEGTIPAGFDVHTQLRLHDSPGLHRSPVRVDTIRTRLPTDPSACRVVAWGS